MKDDGTERRRIVVSLDRGLTWTYAIRLPTHVAAYPNTLSMKACANDGARLVMVGAASSPNASAAFCSRSSAPVEL
jgi:hypothetical protein